MTNIIKFTAKDEYGWSVQPRPVPASTRIPDWWRNVTPYSVNANNPDGTKFIVEDRISNATFKKCTPMLDALSSGYLITLWADVQVRQFKSETGEYFPRITWRVNTVSGVFQQHGESSEKIPPPLGYSKYVFKYMNTWIPRTPSGYSVLFTAPFNYENLPFYAIPGVVDSDKSSIEIIPPMWLQEGFEGVIEAGTPLVQLLPFKRNDWKAEFDYLKDGEYSIIEDKNFNNTLISHYIKKHWSKKSYK
jgi:hypothetical protein